MSSGNALLLGSSNTPASRGLRPEVLLEGLKVWPGPGSLLPSLFSPGDRLTSMVSEECPTQFSSLDAPPLHSVIFLHGRLGHLRAAADSAWSQGPQLVPQRLLPGPSVPGGTLPSAHQPGSWV